MTPSLRSSSAETISRLLGLVAVLSAGIAAGLLLLSGPLADVFFTGWVLVSVGLALVGGIGAWTNRRPLVWITALLLTGLSIVGMWSIGLFIAPAALSLLGSGLVLQVAGPREEPTVANPPTGREALLKSLAGVGSVAVGGSLVFLGAIQRELFEACARETLACTLDKTDWGAVAMTAPGLLAVAVGGGILWRQANAVRLLASEYAD